jgi:ATP-dependent DNA helicase DinG
MVWKDQVNVLDQARIFIVKDVNKREIDEIASAYRELFHAAGGGGLGLFTAVRLLRAVEQRIAEPLAEANINLYAQHVDRLDTGALVDLFRAEENACLLGTDALRDGVDVPGRSQNPAWFSTKSLARADDPAKADAPALVNLRRPAHPSASQAGFRQINRSANKACS